jgi:hypothetical protein
MKRNDTIISSGHFSLVSVLDKLVECGYDVRTYGESESKATSDVEKLRSFQQEIAGRTDLHNKFLPISDYLAGTFTVGGYNVVNNSKAINLSRHMLGQAWFSVLSMHDYGEAVFGSGDVSALILHTDKPAGGATLAKVAAAHNVPVFCIHNGMFSQNRTRYSELSYANSDFYFLRGKYEEEWLQKREMEVTYLTSGSPGWDMYYKNSSSVNKEENIFLYCPLPAPNVYNDVAIFQVSSSWYRNALSSYGDEVFFAAFRKYKDYNPKAKLWVSPRPHTIEGYYENFLSYFDLGDSVVLGGGSFRHNIKRASYLISWVSTAVVEGVINRIPTMLVSRKDFRLDHFNGEGAYLTTTEETIEEGLRKLADESVVRTLLEKCNEKASYYNYKDDGEATKRVVDYMDRALKRK